MNSFHIWYKWSLAWEGVSHVMTLDLDLYLQGHSALTKKIVSSLYHLQFWMDSFYIWHKWLLLLEGVSRVTFFSGSWNLNFWQIFKNFLSWLWKKTSTVLDGFFPYLAQMITSMRGCVAYNNLWPWPISSRSFGLGLENHVRSVASTVPDGLFPYLVQMITSMRRCVACDELWP